MRVRVPIELALLVGAQLLLLTDMPLFSGKAEAGAPGNLLYPDMFPFVDENAPSNMQTLQNWQLSGSNLQYSSMFANQGDGLFEIRRGEDIDSEFYTVLQRVYIDDDNPSTGFDFEDIPIGSAPIPGSSGNPSPHIPPSHNTQSNLIWFEGFTEFSLHEAPVVDGLLTVGSEVTSKVKASWRLSSNRGPLPEHTNPPEYNSPDQAVQQRISVGWADLYTAGTPGQFLDISGVPAGPSYWLRQTVDPSNRIQESDETNNSFEILIDLNTPGEAIMVAGQFVQPGDPLPTEPGDLNEDGQIDLADWLAFQTRAAVDLSGLTPQAALLQGDLDLNGQHGLQDFVQFREIYDQAQGFGAFAALQTAVPEPSTLASLVGLGVSLTLSRWRRLGWRESGSGRWKPG